jgi:hypothetical protein
MKRRKRNLTPTLSLERRGSKTESFLFSPLLFKERVRVRFSKEFYSINELFIS